MTSGNGSDVAEREFQGILRARQITAVFQPIVHLSTGATVGLEALVRGPSGSRFATAASLLEYAYRTDRLTEFDWAARAAACRAALDGALNGDQLLFLNVEPLALKTACPPDLSDAIDEAFAAFQVVLEITERSLARDPRSLMEGIDRQRPNVAGFAIDDLGGESATLSMLPVLATDVIKLDLSITQAGPTQDATKVLAIAYEEIERTGATLLAEGIETVEHAAFARSIGATLGQGHYFGRPEAAPSSRNHDLTLHVGASPVAEVSTPFEALQGWSIGRADRELLIELARQVVYREVPLAAPALLLVHLPDPDLLTQSDREQLAAAAKRGVVVGVLGPGLPHSVAESVRGAIGDDDLLAGQAAVVALSPGTASAVLARALPGPPPNQVFEFGVTHDRRRVVAAAQCLLRRLDPE